MAEKKERKISLPETKGGFQLSGIVTGTEKEKFYVEKITATNKDMRMINFGVETKENSTVFVSINGMERDEVAFHKKAEKKGEKGITKKVKWKDRAKFKEEGFKLLGINLGVKKVLDDKGNEVNDKKILVEYDACEEISKNLKDDQSVFIRGNIEFSSFMKNESVTRSVKFVPNQISLCKDINFEDEKFEENAEFKQTIVFMSIEKDDSDREDIKGRVQAKIVTYNTIEEVEFIIRDTNLISLFRKNLKPYTAITVWGKINNHVEKETVEDTGVWGEESKIDKMRSPFIKELVITGADPKSIDTEVYTEEAFEEAIRTLKEFGETGSKSENWGEGSTSQTTSDTEDDDEAWS